MTKDPVSEEPELRLAIIRNVKLGREDHYGVALWFDAYTTESSAALQVIPFEQCKPILETVDDVHQLNGKPCWVDVSRPGIIQFVKMWGA